MAGGTELLEHVRLLEVVVRRDEARQHPPWVGIEAKALGECVCGLAVDDVKRQGIFLTVVLSYAMVRAIPATR